MELRGLAQILKDESVIFYSGKLGKIKFSRMDSSKIQKQSRRKLSKCSQIYKWLFGPGKESIFRKYVNLLHCVILYYLNTVQFYKLYTEII